MKYPIKTKIYFHSSKEDMYYVGEGLGLSEKQLERFMYIGYEVAADIEVNEDGSAIVTHINGAELKERVGI